MPTIGEILKEARQKKGASESVAAKAIKIKLDRLRDLEENRYEAFPASIYVRSFLRQYAEYLGLDSASLLQRLNEEVPPEESKPVFEITEEQRQGNPAIQRHVPAQPSPSLTSTGYTVIISVVLVILILSACTWWILDQQHRSSEAVHTPVKTQAEPASQFIEPPPPLSLSTNQILEAESLSVTPPGISASHPTLSIHSNSPPPSVKPAP